MLLLWKLRRVECWVVNLSGGPGRMIKCKGLGNSTVKSFLNTVRGEECSE